MLSVESVVRGYHVYKDDWSPSVGDKFEPEIEKLHRHDRYAVAIKVSGDIVGHVPCEFSKIVYYFIKIDSRVAGEVRGFFKAVLGHSEATIFELLHGRPTGHIFSHHVMKLKSL